MRARLLILSAALVTLAACNAPVVREPADVTDDVIVVSSMPCSQSSDYTGVEAIPTVYRETLFEGTDDEPGVGIMIQGPEGSTCTGPVANTLTCVMTGPKFALTIQDTVAYDLPEGRTATLTHNAEGETRCFLNEEG